MTTTAPSPTLPQSASARHFTLAVLALALGGFAIGTTEFVTMGLLPQIADGVGVTIPQAGHVISAYALGVVVGAPVIAVFGAIVNYVLNYHLTFKSTGRHAHVAPRFFAVAAAGLAVNSVCMFALVNYLHLPYLLAQCAATVCVLATTYVANSIWAFKTHTA